MIELAILRRDLIEKVREMDRTELIERIYYVEEGALVLRQERYDMHAWPPGDLEGITASLYACHDRGGWLAGLFDDGRLVGIAAVDNRPLGPALDQLQLLFLHVSNGYRDQGQGTRLFEAARAAARGWGARTLYVSATPSEHTVTFYLARGCRLNPQPDPELFAQEPEDVHLLCDL